MKHQAKKYKATFPWWKGIVLAVVLLGGSFILWYASAPALHVTNRCENLPEYGAATHLDIHVFPDHLDIWQAGAVRSTQPGITGIMWVQDIQNLRDNWKNAQYQPSPVGYGSIVDERTQTKYASSLFFIERNFVSAFMCVVPTD